MRETIASHEGEVATLTDQMEELRQRVWALAYRCSRRLYQTNPGLDFNYAVTPLP